MPQILKVKPSSPESWESMIAETQKVLKGGGVIAFPTDTFFGLGANPWRGSAQVRCWIGRTPSHWGVSKYKYVSRVVTGNTPSKSNIEFRSSSVSRMTRHERLHDRSDLNEWFSNSTVPTRSFVILKNSRKIKQLSSVKPQLQQVEKKLLGSSETF